MPSCHVLVVDDDPAIRLMICTLLDFAGYPVRAAAHGAEALQEVERLRPEIVVLDMQMPVLDGRGFAHCVQERHIPVKILVVTAGIDGHRWAADIAAAGYLAKPFAPRELLGEIERLAIAACPQAALPGEPSVA